MTNEQKKMNWFLTQMRESLDRLEAYNNANATPTTANILGLRNELSHIGAIVEAAANMAANPNGRVSGSSPAARRARYQADAATF